MRAPHQIHPLGEKIPNSHGQVGSGRIPGANRALELTPKAYRYLLERTLDRIAWQGEGRER
jgi:hypothetical protein